MTRQIESVGDDYPKQQARLRKAIAAYESIGPAGAFAVTWMRDLQERADKAAISGDIVEIVRCYKEMCEVKL